MKVFSVENTHSEQGFKYEYSNEEKAKECVHEVVFQELEIPENISKQILKEFDEKIDNIESVGDFVETDIGDYHFIVKRCY